MIEFTIKTLDSFNHNFSVEDETTVSQLKERIRDELGIEIGMQRLIFCGRVMQNHHRLAEYDVDGKVVHLVQRAPPSPQRRATATQSAQRERERERDPNANPSGLRQHIRHLWSVNPPSDASPDHAVAWMTPTSGRLDFIRRTIQDIRNGVNCLRALVLNWDNGDRAEVPVEPMETDTANTATPNAAPNEGEEEDEPDLEEELERAAAARRRNRGARAIRARYTRPRDLGQLIEELDLLYDEFSPYRTSYIRMLRATNAEYTEEERAYRQTTVEQVCDVMHSFAHAYHAISDITLHVGQRYPRLTSEPPMNRHPIPMQAHINVVQTNRRPTQQGNNDAPNSTSTTAGTEAGTGAATATPVVNATNPPATDNNQANQGTRNQGNNQTSPTFGRNTTQPNFNINIQPEPVTYQVEIETRVPIAVPIDNILLNGLAAVANSLHQEHMQNQAQQGQGQAQNAGQNVGQNMGNQTAAGQTAAQAAGQAPPQGQAQAQPQQTRPGQGQQGQGQTDNQNQGYASRTRVLMDIENLLRGLSQGNGVEVVMSMEELPHPPAHFGGIHMPQSNIPTGTATNFANQHPGGGNIIYPGESGVIVTPVFASSPAPTAEILQNVLSNVLRPTFGEGMTYFAPVPSQMRTFPMNTQGQTVGQGQAQPQGQAQGQAQPQNTGTQAQGGQNQAPAAGQTQIPGFQIPTVLTFGQPQGFPGQYQGFPGQYQGFPGQYQGYPGQYQGYPGQYPGFLGQTQGFPGQTQGFPGQTQGFPGQTQGAPGQTQGFPGQTLGAPGQTQAFSGLTQANPGQTQANAGQTQANPGQTQANPGQNQAAGIQTQAAGNQTQASTGQAGGQTFGTGNLNQTQQPGGQMPTTGPNAGNQPQQARNIRHGMEVGPHGVVLNPSNAYPITCLVYDRYMHCDSQYARQHLLERREAFQMTAEAEARERASRLPLPDIDTLRIRNANFTERHMAIMMRLLSGPVSVEGGLNAFMVTVARHLFLDVHSLNANDARPIPGEFSYIRDQLRDYVSDLLETAIERSNRTNPFEAVTERIIRQFSDFLANLPNITRLNRNVDPTTTVRVMIRSRLPAIIACVMSESSSEMFATRFYNVFARFFTDLCTIFLSFFACGFNALLMVYDLFIERITERFEETAREWLRLLSRENLIAISNELEANISSVRQYFRRADGSMIPATLAEQQGEPVEDNTFVNLPHICERHQRVMMPLQAPPLLPPPEDFVSNDTTAATAAPATTQPEPEPETEPAQAAKPAQPDQPTQPQPEQPNETEQDESSQNNLEPEPEATKLTDDQTPEPSSPVKEKHATGDSSSSTMSPYENESRSPKEQRSQGTSPIHLSRTCTPPNEEATGDAAQRQPPSETSSSRSTPDSMRIVPSVILLQHWGEEWVPVFARDQRLQRERERDQQPEPYSDGYLAGMPSRKRRCVRQSRPPTTLDGFMNESIREATERTTTTFDQQELRGVFRESVRTMVRSRASNSEDYDPLRYTSTARFMDQAKANESEKKSKSQDSMD